MVKSDMADFRQKVLAGNVTGEFMARPDDSWEYREVKLEQIKSVIKPTQGSYNQDEPVALVYSEDRVGIYKHLQLLGGSFLF